MKLKVIGYADGWDSSFSDSAKSWAERAAIIDDIREYGYDFNGFQHQEFSRGCPVLNDGTICRYSRRDWGDIMAEAHGYQHPMAYTKFAFLIDGEDLPDMPDEDREIDLTDDYDFSQDLSETFVIHPSDCKVGEDRVTLIAQGRLRYIAKGDSLIIGDTQYQVLGVKQMVDVSPEVDVALYSSNEIKRKKAAEEYAKAPVISIIRVQKGD